MPLAQTGVAPPSPDQAASNVAGWRAELALRFRRLEQRTVLKHSHAGPLRVQRPFYPEGEVCHVYLVHPPAGVVGGDDLQVRIDASAKSAALVTTPGATQFYRSAGDRATVAQQIALTGARLDWLPQENIYFDGAMVEVDTHISIDSGSSFIGWDMHCFGRPAAAENYCSGQVCIKQRLERDGVPMLRERLWVGAPQHTQSSSGLRGQPVCATLLATPVTLAALENAREWLLVEQSEASDPVVLTLIDDLLIARYMGSSTQAARKIFNGLWQLLRPEVHQLPACLPRIWAT